MSRSKPLRIIGLLVTAVMVLTFTALPVAAGVPPLPDSFYGDLTVNGETAPAGVTLVAKIAGVERGSYTTEQVGAYGYSGAGEPKLLVEGTSDDKRKDIHFYIENYDATLTLASGDPTRTFESGADPRKVDLIFEGVQLEAPTVAPAVATNSATGIGTTTATLNGTLTDLGSASSVGVSFEWGTTTAYGRETATRTMTSIGSFSFSLTGLSDDTTYHFRSKAVGDGPDVYGADRIFTTRARPAGGGGVGPAAPPAGTTDVRGETSWEGVFLESVTAISEDELCALTIPEDTVGLTEELEPLDEITMLIMDDPPPPPEAAHVIGLIYDFQPSGATFDPPIALTFSYDPADIPEGIAEEDLVIAYYDEAAGEWIELEGCVVDPVANTITALVSHFTAFGAMFIPAPAAFSLSDLKISPAEAEIGDTITISALVENTSEKEGVCQVTLKVNGKVEETKYATLDPGASKEVTFTTTRDVAGSYSVDVNGLTGSFTVKEKPAPPPPPPEKPPVTEVKPPINWPVVGGIIAGVVIVGLLIFFLVRRRAY